ncbi:thiol:disulfide interchange protein DsbA/DsbL [Shewanella cyperi]|nr:thiol:disulfide interchange protein DsbA/DsbL [Shewanella cyperi]
MAYVSRVLALTLLAMMLQVIGITAQAANFIEGRDYLKVAGIPEAQQPVLREFFSYNCPHCYRKDPAVEALTQALGKQVEFTRTPVAGGRAAWVFSQKAYFLAQQFKLTEVSHKPLFDRIQTAPFRSDAELKDFFVGLGVKAEDLDKALASADLTLALSNYDTLAQLAEIKGVPSLLVNGKYLIRDHGQSTEEMAQLVRFLSEK